MNLEELRTQMNMAPEEMDWLERRKTGDLTPRQTMLASELYTRMMIYTRVPEGPARVALLNESLALRDEAKAVDFETSGMNVLNSLNERIVRLNMRVATDYR